MPFNNNVRDETDRRDRQHVPGSFFMRPMMVFSKYCCYYYCTVSYDILIVVEWSKLV